MTAVVIGALVGAALGGIVLWWVGASFLNLWRAYRIRRQIRRRRG